MSDLVNRTLSIEKTLPAPLEIVWEAWSEPNRLAKWWGMPGMEVTIKEHDFKVGGKWEFGMAMPDGNEFISNGEFLKIEAPHKIHTTANFIPMTKNVELIIELKNEEDKKQTNFTFSVVHETEEYCQQQEAMGFVKGWTAVFDNLERYLSELN